MNMLLSTCTLAPKLELFEKDDNFQSELKSPEKLCLFAFSKIKLI
jgi:hypothetical protein